MSPRPEIGDRVVLHDAIASFRGLRGKVVDVADTHVRIRPDQWDRDLAGIPIEQIHVLSAVERLGELAPWWEQFRRER